MSFVEINNVSKRFGATQALSAVDLSIESGEVHGLLGENGAGKSTLTKILAGVLVPDSGSFNIDGKPVPLGHPGKSRSAGLSMAYQELSAPGNVTVAEKLFLPRLPRTRLGLVSRKQLYIKAAILLKEWEKQDIDPSAPIESIDLADRQHVEIVAALASEPKLLILDEPTASLQDVQWLFRQIRRLARSGSSVIYISHKLPEISEICDRGTVLRNGVTVSQFAPGESGERELVELMIGRSLDQAFPEKMSTSVANSPAVSVQALDSDRLDSIDIQLSSGEIVGIAALEGQGQKELFYSLAGLIKPTGGRVVTHRASVNATKKSKPDFALVPEDRKTEGLFLPLSTKSNMTMSNLREFSSFGTIRPKQENSFAVKAAEMVNLDKRALRKTVQNLSGGNQQKSILARALIQEPVCLLLFDPTRGVDAATKVEIYHMARRFTEGGGALLIYSTEIPELVGLCDRVFTLYQGRLTGEFRGEALSEAALMTGALGRTPKGRSQVNG